MTKGRPTKCTPELIEQIGTVLKSGNYFDTACEFVGIGESTGYHWRKRAEAELARRERVTNPNTKTEAKTREREQPYVDFLEAVKKATAQAEVQAVGLIRQAMITDEYKGQWQAAAWFLERRRPKQWGKHVHVHEDPRDRAIEDIREGVIAFEPLADAFGEEEARRMFAEAGIDAP